MRRNIIGLGNILIRDPEFSLTIWHKVVAGAIDPTWGQAKGSRLIPNLRDRRRNENH